MMKKIFTNIINNNNNVFMKKKKKTIITRGYQSIFVSSSSNYLKCYSNNNFKRDVSTAAKTPITKGEPVPISEPSLKQTNANKSSIALCLWESSNTHLKTYSEFVNLAIS